MAVPERTRRQYPKEMIFDYHYKSYEYAENFWLIKKKEKLRKFLITIIVGTLSFAFFIFVLSAISKIS